jgi:type IV secretory pathway TrbF-like protein
MMGLTFPRFEPNDHPSPVALAGRNLLNDTHLALIQSNRRLFISAIASWCITGLAVAYAGHIGAQSKIEPFVVAVDGISEPHVIGKATASKLHDPLVIENELESWIKALRGVTGDYLRQKQMVAYMQALLQEHSQAFGVLSDWYKQNNPYTRAKTEIVTVDIVGHPVEATPQTWLVDWIEEVRSPTGTLMSRTLHKATIRLAFTTPSTLNPAGLLVRELHW